jgi:hypothetical protein
MMDRETGAHRLLRSLPATAVGDDCDLKVLGQADDVLGEILAAQPLQKADLRVRHKNLRDFIAAPEFHHGLGDIAENFRMILSLECQPPGSSTTASRNLSQKRPWGRTLYQDR